MIADSPEMSTKILGRALAAVTTRSVNSVGVCSMDCKKSTSRAELNKVTVAAMIGVSSVGLELETAAAAAAALGLGDDDNDDESFLEGFRGDMNRRTPFFLEGEENSTEESATEDAGALVVWWSSLEEEEDDSCKVESCGWLAFLTEPASPGDGCCRATMLHNRWTKSSWDSDWGG